MHLLQPYMDSLQLRFLTITRYLLMDYHRMQPKRLEHCVLWLVEEGLLHVEADGEVYKGRSGDLFIFPAGTDLTNRTVTDRTSVISINFVGELPLFGRGNWLALFGIPTHSRASEPVCDIIRAMLQHREDGGIGRRLILQADMLRLMAALVAEGAGHRTDPSRSLGDIRVRKAADYIISHPDRFPQVDELARIADVSESHLRKLFQRHTGLPPAQYVQYIKVEQIKRELVESDQRVTEIAARYGFAEPNYLARLFKARTGHTPTDYRKQYRHWGDET